MENLSGREGGLAPADLANVQLAYRPARSMLGYKFARAAITKLRLKKSGTKASGLHARMSSML